MKYKILFTFIFSTACIMAAIGQGSKTTNIKKAIICLTYDDGLETQLSTAIPQLDSAGLKATFFLNSIKGSSSSDIIGQTPEAVIGWTNAAKNGHELANHTLFHPCPEKLGWLRSVAIESYTIDKIIKEITTQNAILSLLDPARKTRSFAFPCNNVLIGGQDYSKIIQQKKLVKFGRGGGDKESIVTDFKKLNTMQVPSWLVMQGTTLNELVAFAETVKKTGGMGVYQFHGIGGQVFNISSETHSAFLGYLKAHEADYWITTFSEAMEFVTRQ